MNKYNLVIGIEIHLELLTKTKMFSSAPVMFGEKPNTSVDETVLAYPGSMPQVNKKAVELAIMASHLLGMEIDNVLKFDRKHYWYHDLPKGFQITQHKNPIGSNGKLIINGKTIQITRAHLEEDTAKTIIKNGNILIDYNRCGNALLEIVTGPNFSAAEDVVDYINTIKQTMFYAGISNSKMEEGSLRCDINISLNKPGEKLGNRVEIKNLNSTANIVKAINFEVIRQRKNLEKGLEIKQETRRFDETTQKTISMRSKEKIIDYKYIRETNIQDIYLDDSFIKNTISKIPFNVIEFKNNLVSNNFSKQKINELINQFHLKDYIINFKLYKKNIEPYFKIMLNDLSPLILKNNSNHLSANKFANLIEKIVSKKIPSSIYKKVLRELVTKEKDVDKSLADNKIDFIEDELIIKKIIHPWITIEIREVYKKRPQRVEKQLMGQLMKETKGRANPKLAMKIIQDLLK